MFSVLRPHVPRGGSAMSSRWSCALFAALVLPLAAARTDEKRGLDIYFVDTEGGARRQIDGAEARRRGGAEAEGGRSPRATPLPVWRRRGNSRQARRPREPRGGGAQTSAPGPDRQRPEPGLFAHLRRLPLPRPR